MLTYNGLDLKIEQLKSIFLVEENRIQKIENNFIKKIFKTLKEDEIIDYFDSYYYFYYENNELFFSKNLKFFKNNNFNLKEDDSSKYMMLELGYIIPPYTLFKNTYRIFPNSKLKVKKNKDGLTFEIESLHWDLKNKTILNYDEVLIKFKEILNENLKKILKNKDVMFTLSGGADSSLILKLSKEYLKKDDFVVTVESPGQKEELERSKNICKELSINQIVINSDIEDYDRIRIEYIEKYLEPIFDPIAPLEYKIAKQNGDINRVIIEGQAADSLYMGLPHNLAFNLYKKFRPYRKICILLSYVLKNISISKDTKLGRFTNRLKKISNSFRAENEFEFILNILGVHRIFSERNSEYISRIEETIKLLSKKYSGNHLIAYFFMYRILPAREMQKYRMLVDEGYKFEFPYIQGKALGFYVTLPENFLTEKNQRKKIIFDLCKSELKDINFKGRTTPFSIKLEREKMDFKGEGFLEKEIKKIEDKNLISDNLKNYILFKKFL
ncbi:asparagine synthase-related protein [Cetobacterium sp. ZOR0034]|uniref:asparagine synthase-related protein n=1 Tax=Cetobacterium sp. ZOR0034 TaxID=1339239 RepID=UPI0006476828|nr:asparagine synthase-related protein [Cetobacterium sp. ZOR0034]